MRWAINVTLNVTLSLFVILSSYSCSDEEGATETSADVVEETTALTLTESMAAAGLAQGEYRLRNSSDPVCIQVFTYPGGGRSEEPVTLSGFEIFELAIVDDAPVLRGAFDELSARWTEQECVEFDSSSDEITNIEPCEPSVEEEEACTPFSSVRLCNTADGPSFTAIVEGCGDESYGAIAQ